MTTATPVPLDTTPVRPGYEFDEARLTAWMESHVEGFGGPLTVEQFKGGQSNPTYKVMTPGHAYVLRRKPPGELLKGAHAIEREARILTALHSAEYPVARVYGVCTDDSIIGTWFYVMELLQGRIFWDATLPEVSSTERPAYFRSMNQSIARLHNIDYKSLGLADYGRPGNYLRRQITRWSKQYIEDPVAGRDPAMDQLIDWLPEHIPERETTRLVHGDYRCDNLMFHPSEPLVIGVLDWELSTLGNPLVDFAYHSMMYRMPPDIVAGLAGANLDHLNIPSEEDYVAEYCETIGLDGIPDYDFYLAFNFFRLAAIFHGIRGRVIRGTAASADAQRRGECFPTLANLAWKQVQRINA